MLELNDAFCLKDMEEKKKDDAPTKKAEAAKPDVALREKPEPQLVTKQPAAAPAKTTSKPAAEATTKKKVCHRIKWKPVDFIAAICKFVETLNECL